jgi:hypothetical protein
MALESYIQENTGRRQSGPNIFPARGSRRFIVGLDLGQSSDPTAVSVIEHSKTPSTKWKVTEREAAPPTKHQLIDEFFDVRHLARLPLGTPYPQIALEVADLLARPPLSGLADLVIDQTGVGAPVGDLMENAGMRPVRVTITGGNEASIAGKNRFHVPKHLLISTLDARLHVGELRFAADLLEAETMRDELRDFRRHVSSAGRYSYEARTGRHDDLVLSVGIALWWACRPPPPQWRIDSYGWTNEMGRVVG